MERYWGGSARGGGGRENILLIIYIAQTGYSDNIYLVPNSLSILDNDLDVAIVGHDGRRVLSGTGASIIFGLQFIEKCPGKER